MTYHFSSLLFLIWSMTTIYIKYKYVESNLIDSSSDVCWSCWILLSTYEEVNVWSCSSFDMPVLVRTDLKFTFAMLFLLFDIEYLYDLNITSFCFLPWLILIIDFCYLNLFNLVPVIFCRTKFLIRCLSVTRFQYFIMYSYPSNYWFLL